METNKISKNVYLWAFIYFVITALVKWRLNLDLGILIFAIGAVIGLHLLEILEKVMNLSPSPFRSVIAQVLVTILTFFVLTSSKNSLGAAVVLFLNLKLFYLQKSEYQHQSLGSWFGRSSVSISEQNQKLYLNLILTVFILETILFILI